MRRRCRCFVCVLLVFAAWLTESGGMGVRSASVAQAQTGESVSQGEKPVDLLNRSLRMAALQLAAVSVSDGSGGTSESLHLPQRVAVLPLHIEKAAKGVSSRLPIGEPVLRARFMDVLTSVRHGDAFVVAPLASKDMARIVRSSPGGIAKGDKPDAKVLDAARKAKADCVLYGSLTPPASGSREPVWLASWFLISVGSEAKDSAVIKASVVTTLRFDNERL